MGIDGLIKSTEMKFPEDRQHVKAMKPVWGTDDLVRKDDTTTGLIWDPLAQSMNATIGIGL